MKPTTLTAPSPSISLYTSLHLEQYMYITNRVYLGHRRWCVSRDTRETFPLLPPTPPLKLELGKQTNSCLYPPFPMTQFLHDLGEQTHSHVLQYTYPCTVKHIHTYSNANSHFPHLSLNYNYYSCFKSNISYMYILYIPVCISHTHARITCILYIRILRDVCNRIWKLNDPWLPVYVTRLHNNIILLLASIVRM